ncbi:putative protocadherin Fat 1 [Apostichopus japonicus]|uniref:Putative protocadherin Fat 1 n=1 Tax=Stichopus japonicus TaxID=307972 RepID=A0A2G8JWT5_STIJA|nr:putative protocadherin Fat 1 [Apostichopus japonicus]
MSVSVRIPLGSSKAVDRDQFYNIRFSFVTGAYRQFTFSFVDTEEDSFLIDRQSGIVTLNGVLDREIRSEYNLTVKVSDVSQTGSHFTLGNLIIDVLDENDNEPMFEHDLYNATIAENVEVGTVILTVRALQLMKALTLVTYAIDSGNEHGKFEIDGTTEYQIKRENKVRDALDFEKEHAYYLTVKASDAGVRPLSDTTMVNIQVTDVNDNSPVFSQDIYNSEVIEAARVGDSVVQVMASDIDSGPLGDVSYTIVRGDLFNLFTIGSKNGLISLAAELDREQSSSYSLVVRASDSGEVARSQEVTVKISVVDINDNAPRFSSHNYTIIRKEDTPLHTLLIQFNVTDADSPGNGPPFTFSMVSGDRSGFHITYDGALTNTIAFNRKVKETYSLTVMATDSGKPALSSEVSVTIIVVETKNAPVVSSPLVVNIISYQNAFPGGFIARVTASDSDPYDVLEYSVAMDTSQAFQIERESGKIIADPTWTLVRTPQCQRE